jgi:hypothetical protein
MLQKVTKQIKLLPIITLIVAGFLHVKKVGCFIGIAKSAINVIIVAQITKMLYVEIVILDILDNIITIQNVYK